MPATPDPITPINPVILDYRELQRPQGRHGTANQKGVRTYTRLFQVTVDTPLADGGWVRENYGGPQRWLPYLTESWTDLGALVDTVEARKTDNPHVWEVTASYTSDSSNPAQNTDDPLARAPEVQWAIEKYRVVPTEDEDGEPYTNSSDEPVEGIEVDRLRLVLTWSRNVEVFSQDNVFHWADHVNEAEWFGFPARTAKLEDDRGEGPKFENGVNFWKETLVIKIDPAGWKTRYLDQGFREIVAGAYRVILDTAGRPLTTPALLNGSGVKLAPGSDPVFIERRTFADLDFTVLHIP